MNKDEKMKINKSNVIIVRRKYYDELSCRNQIFSQSKKTHFSINNLDYCVNTEIENN